MIGPLRAAFHRRLRRRAGHLAGRIAPHLPTGATVLDIGSGTGHNAEALRARGACTCVEADVVDFHVVGGGPVLFDGARLPFADRVFDACLLAFVLSYTDDPAALLREAGRVASRRVLVLQSSPRGRAGRIALWLRSWVQGRVAFRLCATLRLIPPSPTPLRSRRMLSRERVGELAERCGVEADAGCPEPGLLGLVSRDLFVLEGPPGAPASRPRTPERGRNAHEAAPTPDLGGHPREERGGADRVDRGVGPAGARSLPRGAPRRGGRGGHRGRQRERRRHGRRPGPAYRRRRRADGDLRAPRRGAGRGTSGRGWRAAGRWSSSTPTPGYRPGRSSGSRNWSTSKDTRRGSHASARSTADGGPAAGGPSGTPCGGSPCRGPRRCRPACSAPERPSTSSGRSTSASPSARSGRSWPGSTAPGLADSSTIKPSRR